MQTPNALPQQEQPAPPKVVMPAATLTVDDGTNVIGQTNVHITRVITEANSSDYERIPDDSELHQESNKSCCCCRCKPRYVWLAVPLLNALADAAESARGMKDARRTQVEWIVGAIIRFFESAGLNGKESIKGFEETVGIIVNKSLPEDWEKLSRGKEAAALMIAIPIGGLAATAEALATYNFVDSFGATTGSIEAALAFRVIAFIAAAAKGLNTIGAEGMTTYSVVRSLLANQKKERSQAQKVAAWIAGIPLGIIGGVSEFVEDAGSIAEIFKATAGGLSPGYTALAIACGIGGGFADIGLKGTSTMQAVRDFVGYIQTFRERHPKLAEVIKDVLVFLTAGALAGWLAFAQMGLIVSLLGSLAETAAISGAPMWVTATLNSQILSAVLGYGTLVRDTLLQTSVLYPLMHKVADKIGTGFGILFGKCCAARHSNPQASINSAAHDLTVVIETVPAPSQPHADTRVRRAASLDDESTPLVASGQATYATMGRPSQTGMYAYKEAQPRADVSYYNGALLLAKPS